MGARTTSSMRSRSSGGAVAGKASAIKAPAAKATAAKPAAKSVRGSRTGKPVMALLELLGRRWAMRALWELRGERLSFRGLQEACDGVSPAVLNERLRELREARLVDQFEGEGYGLSTLGRELLERFSPLVGWAERWAAGSRRA